MVDFGILILCLCAGFLLVMMGLQRFIKFMHDWNIEKLIVETHNNPTGMEKPTVKEEDSTDKKDDIVSPFDLTQNILKGTIDIDKELEE